MIGSEAIAELRSSVRGRVLEPADPDYEPARTLVYGGFDQRPGVIVQVADAEDVARVVTFAREGGLELAIRGGEHAGDRQAGPAEGQQDAAARRARYGSTARRPRRSRRSAC